MSAAIPELAGGADERRPAPPALRRVTGLFDAITLAELGDAALMERADTRFVIPARLAAEVLLPCLTRYRALEVAGTRICRYESLYYDTDELTLYHDHHRGRAERVKVRRRSYLTTDTHFLEVKRRTNDGRTCKSRVPIDARSWNDGATDGVLARLAEEPFAGLAPGLSRAVLRPVVQVSYTRLTLVRRDGSERATFDLDLSLANARGAAAFPGAVVVEVKQPRHGPSPVVDALRALGVRAGGISKYCLGVVALESRAKTNRFKPALRHLLRIADPHAHIPHAR